MMNLTIPGRRPPISLFLIALVTAAALLISGRVPATKASPIVQDKETWRYTITPTDGGGAQVSIAYDHESVQGLLAFAQANRVLALQLQATGTPRLTALITFKRPLGLNEFTELAAANGLIVSSYTIRMSTPGGERWTITGAPADNVLVPQVSLNRQVSFVRQKAPEAVFNGVVDVTASFDVSRYTTLQAAPAVFLIDVTRTLAKQEALQALPQVDERKILISEPEPYWFMEDVGLQNFR